MKYTTLTLVMLSACTNLSSMEKNITILQRKPSSIAETKIQVPSNVIYDRLCNELHLNSFVHQTRIHEQIGNNALLPGQISLRVNSQVCAYLLLTMHQHQNNPQFLEEHSAFIKQKQPFMIKAILKDHPPAIEYLIKEGFIKEEPVKLSKQQPIKQNNNSAIVSHTNKRLQQKTRIERLDTHWQMFIDNK